MPSEPRLADEFLALLDHRLGERLGEGALRQHELIRLALALCSAWSRAIRVMRHPQPGPGMRGEILRGAAVDLLGVGARQLQLHDRRAEQRLVGLGQIVVFGLFVGWHGGGVLRRIGKVELASALATP